jgi:amidohydrolase
LELINVKQQITGFIELIKDELISVSKYIHDNPELGYKEFKAQQILTDTLKKYGFNVENNFLGLGTEFKATFGEGSPSIAFLCEYDALPEIGHGCGHNIIGTAGIAAAIGLSRVIDKAGGRVVVFGTPAEESSGAKVIMAEKGAFDGIDAAMMIHPSDATSESGMSLAIDALEFTFNGRSSHAAANPERGINALNACIETFNLINAMRQHVTSDIRIHGIISEGGTVPNVVPDRAVARFYVRSMKRSTLDEVTEKVKNCARAAAMGVGAEVDIRNYELSYDNMITNHTLSRIFSHNLKECGIIDIQGARNSFGSIDMGNVSHVVPAIHPYVRICDEGVASHSRDFAEVSIGELANENMIKAACAMAFTGLDIFTNPDLLNEVKEEFELQRSLK